MKKAWRCNGTKLGTARAELAAEAEEAGSPEEMRKQMSGQQVQDQQESGTLGTQSRGQYSLRRSRKVYQSGFPLL